MKPKGGKSQVLRALCIRSSQPDTHTLPLTDPSAKTASEPGSSGLHALSTSSPTEGWAAQESQAITSRHLVVGCFLCSCPINNHTPVLAACHANSPGCCLLLWHPALTHFHKGGWIIRTPTFTALHVAAARLAACGQPAQHNNRDAVLVTVHPRGP